MTHPTTLMKEIEQIEKEIQSVQDFTRSYWVARYSEWENDPSRRMDSPNYGEVCRDIIYQRRRYVLTLRQKRDELVAVPAPSSGNEEHDKGCSDNCLGEWEEKFPNFGIVRRADMTHFCVCPCHAPRKEKEFWGPTASLSTASSTKEEIISILETVNAYPGVSEASLRIAIAKIRSL